MPEKAQESTEPAAGFGASTHGSFAYFDRASSSWRTCQRCLVEGSDEFSETWPRAGTMRNGIASAHPRRALRTNATDSLLWLTPSVEDQKPAGPVEVAMMRKYESGENVPDTYKRLRSQAVARTWPTPTKEDSRGGISTTPGGARKDGLNAAIGGSLNPTWVEWLMGFPAEWTALSASETPSSRKSRKSSGAG